MKIQRQIWVALGGVVGTTILVYGILSLLPKTYASAQSVYFPLSQSSPGSSALAALGAQSTTGGDAVGIFSDQLSPLVGSSPSVATGILKSRSCLTHVANTLGLQKKWHSNTDQTVDNLKGDISVSVDENGLLVISAQAETPQLCVDIIDTMYAYLEKRSDELTLNVGKKNREYFTDRVATLEKQTHDSELEYIKALQQSEGVTSSTAVTIYSDLISKLTESKAQEASAAITLDKLKAQATARLNALKKSGADIAALSAVDRPDSTLGQTATQLAAQLEQRRLKLLDVSKQFTKSSAEYKAALAEVQTAESQADKLIANAQERLKDGTLSGIAEAEGQLAGLKALNGELEKTLDVFRGKLEKAPADDANIARTQAKFNSDLQTLQSLRLQLEKARLQEQNDPARFEIVDPAVPISKAVAPRKAFLTGVWFVFAVGCFGWWVIRQRIQFVQD